MGWRRRWRGCVLHLRPSPFWQLLPGWWWWCGRIWKRNSVCKPSSSYGVTVGLGGSHGGGPGEPSSFASLISATGGSPGGNGTANGGGAGGPGGDSSAAIHITGEDGGNESHSRRGSAGC